MTEEREDVDAGFGAFVDDVGGRVRRALVPVAGPDAARDATTDALVHAWQQWDRVRAMANPAGYVYTVARSRLPRRLPPTVALPGELAGADRFPDVEPGLARALAALPERQRVAVYLQVGCRWPTPEVAALLGISVSTVRNHTERGLARLRTELGVPAPGTEEDR
jgi:DNA-directed RNA polymerase specialized sigma24 family protein